MKKILFATDGSDSTKKAAAMASEFLEKWPEAQLLAAYVTKIVTYPYDASIPDVTMEYEDTMAAHIKHEVKDVLFKKFGDRVHFVHTTGSPVQSLCDMADAEDADFIIIGSHGRGAVDRLMLGSVSHGVVNRTKRPVLVVRG